MELKKGNIHRTTFDQICNDSLPHAGVYVIAYMGKILYVGKAEDSVTSRLINHMKYTLSNIGCWLNVMEWDWSNIRLDILEPPASQDRYWLSRVENACIKKFNPLFNKNLLADNAFGTDHYRKHSCQPPPYPTHSHK